MHEDSSRNKMDVKFYCSKHPQNELTFSTDLSKIGANSAFEINVNIMIHPCSICQQEVDQIKDAVNFLLSVKDGR